MFRVVGSTVGTCSECCVVFARVTHPLVIGAMVPWWFIRLLFAHQLHIRFSGSIDTKRTTIPVYCLPPLDYSDAIASSRGGRPAGRRAPAKQAFCIWFWEPLASHGHSRWLIRPSLSVVGFLQPSTPYRSAFFSFRCKVLACHIDCYMRCCIGCLDNNKK